MAIVVENFPSYSFARSFVAATISTNNFIIANEQFAELTINIYQVPTTAPAYFQISLNGKILQLSVVNYVPSSNFEIPNAANYSGTLLFYQAGCYQKLSAQPDFPYFYERFNISFDPYAGKIYFKSREANTSYLFTGNIWNSNGITLSNIVTTGVAKIVRPDFKFLVRTYVEQNLLAYNFESAGTDNYIPDSNSEALLNLSEYIAASFKNELPILTLGIQDLNEILKRFSVNVLEYWDGAIQYDQNLILDFKKAINAFHGHKSKSVRNADENFINFENKWLTKRNRKTFEVSKKTWNFISLVFSGAINQPKNLRVSFKFYLNNGTTVDVLYDTVSTDNVKSFSYNFILNSLSFSGFTFEEIEKIHVYMVDFTSNAKVSDDAIFVIDHKMYDYEKTIVFKNHYGAWETIRTIGHVESEIEHEFEIGQQYLSSNHSVSDAGFLKLNAEATKSIKTSIGFDSVLMNNYYQEMLGSNACFEVIGSELHPIVILSKKSKPGSSIDIVSSLELEYMYAYNIGGK